MATSIWRRAGWIVTGGLIGAVLFGGATLILSLATGSDLDLAKVTSLAIAGAIVVSILVGAGRPGRTR